MVKDNIISSDVYHLIKMLNSILKRANLPQTVSVESALYYKDEDGNLRIEFKYIFHDNKKAPEVVFQIVAEVDPYEFFNKNNSTKQDINDSFFTAILRHSNFAS
jgi:hypothetical protein